MLPFLKRLLCAAVFALWAVPAAAQDCVMDAWERILAPGFQTHELKERFATPQGPVVALEFGELKGEHAKLYLFLLDSEDCFREAIVAGSYDATTIYAQEAGRIPADARLYHIDHYSGSSHETVEFRETPPGYDEVRQIAVERWK